MPAHKKYFFQVLILFFEFKNEESLTGVNFNKRNIYLFFGYSVLLSILLLYMIQLTKGLKNN